MVVVLAQWVAAGITSLAPGSDPLPTYKLVLMRILEWGQFAVLLYLLARFVVRPLAHRQELGFDGLFILAALVLNFWDPLDNYLNFAFQYNAHFINVRSWGEFIPGWSSGPDVWAVPILFVTGAYTWAFFGAATLGCWIVDRLGERQPSMPIIARFGVVFVANAAISGASELVFLQTSSIANIGTPDSLTLWSDRYNGWPIYNPIFFGLAWTAVAWLRWSRNEHGLSVVERGVDQLPVGRSARTALRFLAIFAFTEVSYILLYFVPWNLFALFHDPWPPIPSWFPVP
jgi:hypothetical protein